MQVWRICRALFAAEAFSGEGARRFGGRWNSRGMPMVYASSSLALAAIELFVHLDPNQQPDDLVYVSAALPAGEPLRSVAEKDLPASWWLMENSAGLEATRALGDAWVKAGESLAMEVPSAALRPERNVLINPAHEAVKEIVVADPVPFVFDARMFTSRATRRSSSHAQRKGAR
ncbi:MAG: RES family NAD+ phosphorylase [Terracidiphilus sp.]